MRRGQLFLTFMLTLFLLSPSTLAGSAGIFNENETIIDEFQVQLKQQLGAAMKRGGPTEAIDVCAKQAPLITQTLSAQYNVQLQRISDKFRNPSNRPSAAQASALEYFKADAYNSDVYAQALGSNQSLYAKPIKTDGICLACHGQAIATEVKQALEKHYPRDQATGYELGELRGIFSIIRPHEKQSPLGIKNFKVLSQDLWVGGQPSKTQIKELKALGIGTIINLRTLGEMTFDESSLAESLDMNYSSIPIAGAEGISIENSKALRKAIDQAEGPVFLHCASSNRVGALLALDVAANGADSTSALAAGRAGGMRSLTGRVSSFLDSEGKAQ